MQELDSPKVCMKEEKKKAMSSGFHLLSDSDM